MTPPRPKLHMLAYESKGQINISIISSIHTQMELDGTKHFHGLVNARGGISQKHSSFIPTKNQETKKIKDILQK